MSLLSSITLLWHKHINGRHWNPKIVCFNDQTTQGVYIVFVQIRKPLKVETNINIDSLLRHKYKHRQPVKAQIRTQNIDSAATPSKA